MTSPTSKRPFVFFMYNFPFVPSRLVDYRFVCYLSSFLISDADIYDGTGWHIRGEHTAGFNTNATGIAFIGNFSENLPTPRALELAKQLLACGKAIGELDEDYVLLGGRQVIATESPGLELYGEIQEWDHWKSRP